MTQGTHPRGSVRAAVNKLGRLIVTSRPGYQMGEVISLEMVSRESGGGSRALAREVLQVLRNKRLVSLQPRIGATVLADDQWDAFDPDVIAWRLEVEPRFQMRSLTEIRTAIEPMAASLAAERASSEACRSLVSLSRQLQELGNDETFIQDTPAGADRRTRYRDVDVKFHTTMLKGSQNEMLYALAGPVKQALDYRIEQDRVSARRQSRGVGGNSPFPDRPSELALWLHRGLAASIEAGVPQAAESFSRAILLEVRATPLPPLIGIALAHTLPMLGHALGDETAAFTFAITAAAQSAKEGTA
jgi:DNA-binding FadR family transcriptional regulator